MAKRDYDMRLELVSVERELIQAEQETRYWRDAFEREHALHTSTAAELKLVKMAEGDAFLRGVYVTAATAFLVIGLVAWMIA